MFPLSYPPLFEHHSLPSCPAYLCMPAKKYFVSISIPIAYDSRSAAVSSGTPRNAHLKNRPDVHGGCQPQFLMQQLILCVFLRSHSSGPTGGLDTLASQLPGPFSCTCPPPPRVCAPVCSSTPGQGAIRADAPPPQLGSERLTWLWWHLMRKVQVF